VAIDDVRVNLTKVLDKHDGARCESDSTCSKTRICSGSKPGVPSDVTIDESFTRGVIASAASADISLINRRTRTISTSRCRWSKVEENGEIQGQNREG
jgi:hypothetical protein